MLTFQMILESSGFDPNSVLIIRHTAREPRLQKLLPWLAEERRDLFLAYQRIQWRTGERAMMKASHVAAFVGLASGEATFAGLSKIAGNRVLAPGDYEVFPGYDELIPFGMVSDRSGEGVVAFDLEPQGALDPHLGRLSVGWSVGQTWARWAARNQLPVVELARESRFVPKTPNWRELSLSWQELRALPTTWQADLAHWRGIYFIYDAARARGYVGSAAGAENLLGRWRQYGVSGHGGNVGLRSSRPDDLHFSILERTSPDMPIGEVVHLEDTWKQRLQTRRFGLNAN